MNYKVYFKNYLEKLKDENLYREIPLFDKGDSKYIEIKNKKLLNLASNNYLGLSNKKEIKEGAIKAIKKYGCSSSASRIVTGNFLLYNELELGLAKFKGYEAALIFNTGYVANLSIISAICDKNWVIFSDKLNHASIIDGTLLSKAKHERFRHLDYEHLETILKRYNKDVKKLIITDTVFSMDGDVADLEKIVKLAKDYNALVMIDEAHATGIFGKGRGLAHELGLEKEIDINMGTFSKGLGSFGAYVCCNKSIKDYLVNKARGFIFSTSLPPAVIGANLAAIKFIKENYQLGERLIEISKKLRKKLNEIGFNTLNSSTQIIPIIIGNREKLQIAKDFLIESGLYVAAIRPPTVPIGTDRLRLSLRADLTDDELELIVEGFRKLKERI
ncbi:8-amino-7-oxononanoate synthase [Deferribacter desulfuricans SSM1]|uniref:8-amino-7-ketopelargonate synthase n=1 Tax=Deferribacter desulfuricans (strain DSM 14783 / JCM 11476 / NBRC 101012 / SSM1) TaxID=639282 RepID=D3PDU5_DEFDS|nr:8-amino-7-oxononanoate synthase [Deferribacter desulfuricans]BAI80768.1 8-amino-7-oxononanoate synthase [Deferribacter desulfuricans SSM1]